MRLSGSAGTKPSSIRAHVRVLEALPDNGKIEHIDAKP